MGWKRNSEYDLVILIRIEKETTQKTQIDAKDINSNFKLNIETQFKKKKKNYENIINIFRVLAKKRNEQSVFVQLGKVYPNYEFQLISIITLHILKCWL